MRGAAKSYAPFRYGVLEQTAAANDIEYAAESLRHLGYAVIDGNYETSRLQFLAETFENVHTRYIAEYGGMETLAEIDEHRTIRLPLAYEPIFLELASNAKVLDI